MEPRWKQRPLASLLIRALAFLSPIAVATLVAANVARRLPAPEGAGESAIWWFDVIALSFVALVVAEHYARRLLPLAALFRLSLVFPDKTPSRWKVARKAFSMRTLERELTKAREMGVDRDPQHNAEQVLALVSALTQHDRRTRGHSERVRIYVDMIAEEIRLGEDDQDRLRWSALLHDIGKLTVPNSVLNKPSDLDELEWELVRTHPIEGRRLAEPLLPYLGKWAQTIEHHHERWDGSGYPHGLKGKEINQGARIVAVADAYDVMTAARPYSKPLTAAEARGELARWAGKHFDPQVVRALMSISLGKLWRVIGFATWVAALPFIPVKAGGVIRRAGERVATSVTTAAATVTVAFMVVAAPPPELPLPPAIPPVAAPASPQPVQVLGAEISKPEPSAAVEPVALPPIRSAVRSSDPPSAPVTIPNPPPPPPQPEEEPSFKNHGQCVSSHANQKEREGSERGGHGAHVRDFAKDECP